MLSTIFSAAYIHSNIPGLRIKLGIPGEHFVPLQSLSPENVSSIKLLIKGENKNDQGLQNTLPQGLLPEKKKKSKRKRSSA